MYLFQSSICFEQPRAHHKEKQFYQYNLWYILLCVGDLLVCKSGRKFFSDLHTKRSPIQSDIYQMLFNTIDSPDDKHKLARNMYRIEINTQKRIVRQVGHLPRIITRCTVKKT
jgi:hypothetical protein